MSYKILEQNGVENKNIDGSALNNAIFGGNNGIIKGLLNECRISSAESSLFMDTGELVIQGFRIKVEEPIIYPIESFPILPTKFFWIFKITLAEEGEVSLSHSVSKERASTQDNLYQSEQGTYEIAVAEFVLSPNGISSVFPLIKVLENIEDAIDKLRSLLPTYTSLI